MTARVVRVNPAEAARRALWWRKYAALAQTDAERVEREAVACAYQAQAQCGDVADKHDASEAVE